MEAELRKAVLADAAIRRDLFPDDVSTGVIMAVPATERLLCRVVTRTLLPGCDPRTVDAPHFGYGRGLRVP